VHPYRTIRQPTSLQILLEARLLMFDFDNRVMSAAAFDGWYLADLEKDLLAVD
jgi:hypothetical protein